MKRAIRHSAVLPFLALPGCVTAGVGFEISASAFLPQLRGDAALEDSGGGSNQDVGLRTDLDLDDVDVVPEVRIAANALGLNLAANAFRTEQSGTGTLGADFGDLSVGTDVDSRLDLTAIHGALTLDIVNVSFLRLAPGIGVDYFDLELDVDEIGGALDSERIQLDGPVPLVVVQAEAFPPFLPLELLVEAGGIGGEFGDFEGLLLDVEALLRWEVVDSVEIFAGYRYLSFEAEGTSSGNDFDADVLLNGVLVGAGIRF